MGACQDICTTPPPSVQPYMIVFHGQNYVQELCFKMLDFILNKSVICYLHNCSLDVIFRLDIQVTCTSGTAQMKCIFIMFCT